MKLQTFIFYCGLLTMVCGLIGCDAFVRKFTRKPTKDAQAPEMILQPEEFKGPQMTKEELYRQYYLFWSSWQEELINALIYKLSQKKQLDCAAEALKNLEQMKLMLKPEKQKIMLAYIEQLKSLISNINSDIYGNDNYNQRVIAQRLKTDIHRDFVYSNVEGGLL